MKEMKSPEYVEKRTSGPVMILTVMPGGPITMAKPLVLWFVYSLVVGFFAAYIAAHALPPGAPYPTVFRMVGCDRVRRLLRSRSGRCRSGTDRKWSTTIRTTIDGLIYGC